MKSERVSSELWQKRTQYFSIAYIRRRAVLEIFKDMYVRIFDCKHCRPHPTSNCVAMAFLWNSRNIGLTHAL